MIRLVTFDALHTLITPRKPFHVQYSEVFRPFLGDLPPDALSKSFKQALKQVQAEKPVYQSGATNWWTEVVRRTATGAGADPHLVEKHMDGIMPSLMHRFSSSEGYKLFDDALDTLMQLKEMGVRTGLITNADSRIVSAMGDLGVLQHLSPVIVSEQMGHEKPSLNIFLAALVQAKVRKTIEALHVGDDLVQDYRGALNAGMHSMLVRRPGLDGAGESKEEGEDLAAVRVAPNLAAVVEYVRTANLPPDEPAFQMPAPVVKRAPPPVRPRKRTKRSK
ncbi:HAD-like protein [Auriscalpium vulgare]|uniref:HAD-like protein n=1 Tax=Auriscalpium vulgare TaxID=40419 RepID=A0ACB8S514_9AGAM|nr:HAD-like protein [Auriscalpium vulgare]